MPDFSVVQQLPDVNFISTSVNDLLAAAISTYEQSYYNLTGESVTVQPGDDVYIILYSNALQLYSILQSINVAARMNLLKYASGNYLDQLAANSGVIRSEPAAAVATQQFNLSAAQSQDVTIPQGTRVTAGDGIYFATDEDAKITAGNTSVQVTITCTVTGTVGNGYIPGQLNTLVDSVPFVTSAINIETTEGGSDLQSDLSLAEQTFSASGAFSVAGPSGAYDYLARQFSSDVVDTYPVSPSACVVNLYVMLKDGVLPNQAFLNDLAAYIGADKRRPMTDQLNVLAPTLQSYNLNLTYYIDPTNAGQAATIQSAVTTAVNDFITWTKSKIGRDIIPDELTRLIREAGAKRAVITSPAFTQIPNSAVAVPQSITITYGGADNA